MRALGQGNGVVEEDPCAGHDLLTTLWVVALATRAAVGLRNGIGAIEGIVKTAPACIGCIEGVAGIENRNHQLRPGLNGQFVIDIGRGGLDCSGLCNQVANLGEEGLVGRHVLNGARMGQVPGIEFGLQAVALREQGIVLRRELCHDLVEAGPEGVGADARVGQHFLVDEGAERRVNFYAVDGQKRG